MKRAVIIIAALFVLITVGRHLRPTSTSDGFNINEFSELPVQVGGRIKPLDTVARNTLLVLASRQKVVSPSGETISPIEWLLDLTMRPEKADTYRVFKIEFPDDLGLPRLAQEGQRYYSFNDLLPHFEELNKLAENIDPEHKKRTPYEQQIYSLNQGLTLYHQVMHSLHPIRSKEGLDQLIDEYSSYKSLVLPAMQELRKQQAGEEHDTALLRDFIAYGDDYLKLSQTAYLRIVPPPPPANSMDDWENIGLDLLDVIKGEPISAYTTGYASLTMAYRANDVTMFNQTVGALRERFIADFPSEIKRVHFERVFNKIQPFALSMELYVLAFLAICISWLRWTTTLNKVAFWILLFALLIHTVGLISRMYIQGRPPVTNLYSSAVFVGWGAVLLGAFLERFYRNGIGAAMAALVGFCTLIIAHHLAMDGDTLEMMRAVLDSNFWLATHVVIITFGYSAMFFAGMLAIAFIIGGIFVRSFTQKSAQSLSGMVYGITCFATLFSLVGTILGGIWGDQSWGRFWGWDPKENGALMIVIMGAILLHARWGGVVRERGIMAIAVCGNIVTAWSWFGTNLLGVGLHSYGFTDKGFKWLAIFYLSQLVFILLANLPWSFWRSNFGTIQQSRKKSRGI